MYRIGLGLALLAAGCSYLPAFGDPRRPPQAIVAFFDDLGRNGGIGRECRVLVDEARRVASAPDPYGGPDLERWVAPTSSGGQWDVVAQIGDDGRAAGSVGGGGGCRLPPPDPSGIAWSGGGGAGPPNPYVYGGGRLPEGAVSGRLTWVGAPPVTVDAQTDGYFLVMLAEDPGREMFILPPTRIEALDADGAVIATLEP